jgi:hypothetical protein
MAGRAGNSKRPAESQVYNFTSGKSGVKLVFRVQLRDKKPTGAGRLLFGTVWYQSMDSSDFLSAEYDTSEITFDYLKTTINEFVEDLPTDASGTKFVCDNICMSGSYIYVPEDCPKELNPGSSTKRYAKPITNDIDLAHAINKLRTLIQER